jgi:uroporphyrinogen decarboxylase
MRTQGRLKTAFIQDNQTGKPSMTSMNSRERVLAAIHHQGPDRVPTALGGGPYGIVDELYLGLIQLLNLGSPVTPFRSGHSISYMDDRLLDRLGTDIRYCWPGLLPNSPIIPGEDGTTFYDSYGQIWHRAQPYFYAGEGILHQAESVDDIERLVRWPELSDPRWATGLEERARLLRENTRFFVTMRMVASHGPFQTACDLRGTENFLMDLVLRPEFARALLDRITESIAGLLRLAMRAGGKWFDMVELPGDDYAGNTGPIISPAMFREFIQPCLLRLVHAIKENNPDTLVMLHSDGAITPLLPDILDLGIDVIHPLEPLPATDTSAVKARFGERITFLGGIDISHAMPGTVDDVIAEVKHRIALLAPGGGYILAPSNHLQTDVPPENVIALYQTAHETGQYPIS